MCGSFYKYTESSPPPNDLYISDVSPTHLTFNWSPLTLRCPSTRYLISTNGNCGTCPQSTASTSATCTNMTATINDRICSLTVQTEICGFIRGELSDPLLVKLNGNNYYHKKLMTCS